MGENYVSFYEGGYSSLNPNTGNYVGFRLNAGELASTTSPQTANQLNETIARIKEGVTNIEVSLVSPDIMDGIPKQQFEEMQALMKLTGVKPSVHAPVIDPAGIGQQAYSEESRQEAERRFIQALEHAKVLDPNGNIPVVFHGSNSSGQTYSPEGKEGDKDRFNLIQDTIVNLDTGHIQHVQERRNYHHDKPELLEPGKDIKKQGDIFTTERALRSVNQSEWDNKIREIAMLQKEVEETGERNPSRAQIFLEDAELSFRNLFNRSYEHGTLEQQKALKKLAENWQKEEEGFLDQNKERFQLDPFGVNNELLNKRIHEMTSLVRGKDGLGMPKTYMSTQEFATKKAAETFGNIAWNSYEKWKDKSPVIAIENLYPGMGFSRADDLKKLIEESKNRFVENAMSKGMGRSEAKEKADKFIGATWDVGHLNLHKKHGFTDKDLAAETKKIAPLVKHVHLTDNFGFGDSHLGIGMGNVPIKEHLKVLEKQGKFKEMRKVIEAGGLVNPNMGLKMNPFRETLGAFGSGMGDGSAQTYWNQIQNIQGNYMGFPMAYMPEKHFSLYGSGFSTLPQELGGQVPGTGSRFSGTPTA